MVSNVSGPPGKSLRLMLEMKVESDGGRLSWLM